ncbi:MAG: hypothetical protein J6P84_05565 [Alphaproteobacteria bacterium]|nr:hypothetical protein [Alphaproteobacteria bacterium]
MSKKYEVDINGIRFSSQEMAIVEELKKGATYREIAEKLSISVKAIDYHVKNLKEKTKANSKKELLDFFEKNKENLIVKKILILGGDKRFLRALILILLILLGVTALLYPQKHKPLEITNISNFTDNFLNRPYIEDKVIQKLKWQKGIQTVVIFGTGGAGKTTVARKVVSLLKGDVKFEVNAETGETLYNSFMELADHLAVDPDQRKEIDLIRNLQNVEYRKKRLVRLISMLLKQKDSWVLLMDNVGFFENIKEYFPANEEIWGQGCVLITTRNQNLGNNNFIKAESLVNIGRLEEQEKKELFSNIVFRKEFAQLDLEDKKRVSEFLVTIPEFPLDVSAAAYYIKNTNITLEEYSQLIAKSINELNSEQRDLIRENSGYSETRYGIISSSLKEVLNNKAEYKLLLLALSLLDSQNIPKYILKDIAGTLNADNFIRRLREKSLVTDSGAEISIHRSSHKIGYDYITELLTDEELASSVHAITKVIFHNADKKLTLIPHLDAMLSKISKVKGEKIAGDKSRLLLLISEILRTKSYRMKEAMEYLGKVVEINEGNNCLGEYNLARVKFRMGEIYTVMNKISLADKYLVESLKVFRDNSLEKVHAYMILGIVRMRQRAFEQSNECFTFALKHLQFAQMEDVRKGLFESNILENMAFNYFVDGINRDNTRASVDIMKKAIEVLSHEKFDKFEPAATRRNVQKAKLAGIYNALGEYQQALGLAKEAEKALDKAGYYNADTLYARGIIALERGLAYLRMSKVSRAYKYFLESESFFSKLMKGEYLFRVKCHEVECMIRLNKLDEAMQICENVLNYEDKGGHTYGDRERNNYCDLLYDTCIYHAAIIGYRKKNFDVSQKYFQDFFKNIRKLCKEILPESTYHDLEKQKAFDESFKSMRGYFENSLKIFEAIYGKNYEFNECYVGKNLLLTKRIDPEKK